MIPVRIKLEGFLSYCDETILEFDSAPLWMLSGPNGAGKSAIFDAISYVLYGQHRGGKQGAQQLINHQSDRLIVEFDFRLGEDVFRAKRTYTHKGKATREVIHLSGPNRPIAKRTGPVIVPSTDEEAEYDEWIVKNVGLSSKTFLASAMLRQGESDALLRMKSKERHDVLLELVDLSAYQRLAERAADKHTAAKGEYEGLEGQLKGTQEVDPQELEVLAQQVTALNTSRADGNNELDQLANLESQARHWKRLLEDYRTTKEQLDAVENLVQQADTIKAQAARLGDLNASLPHLAVLVPVRDRLVKAKLTIQGLEKDVAEANQQLAHEREEYDRLNHDLKALDDGIAESTRRVMSAHKEADKWRPVADNLARIVDLEGKLSKVKGKLKKYPEDLAAKLSELQAQVAHLDELNSLLPWLKQIVALRASWVELRQNYSEAQSRDVQDEAARSQLQQQLLAAQQTVAIAKEQCEASQGQIIRAEEQINYLKLRQANLASVEGKATCEYCGQLLTTEHIATEAARLDLALEQANQSYAAASLIASKTDDKLDEAEAAEAAIQKRITEIDLAISKVHARMEAWNKQGIRAVKDARQAIRHLPRENQAQYALSQGADWDVAWSERPNEAEIADLEGELALRDNLNSQLTSIRSQNEARNKLVAEQDVHAEQLTNARSAYSDEQRAQAQAAYKAALAMVSEAQAALSSAQSSRSQRAKVVNAASERVSDTQNQLISLNGQLTQQTVLVTELQGRAAEHYSQLNVTWQAISESLDKPGLHGLQMEQSALAKVPERLSELDKAQGVQVTLQNRLVELDGHIAEIPPDAQRDPEEVAESQTSLRAVLEQIEQKLTATLLTEQRLVDRQNLREKLLSQQREAGRRSDLYKELSRLLGRDNLQSYLLAEVETSVVDNANAVLDKISGGTLRLELQDSAGAASAKALDLVAYNSQASSKPIGVEYLSGSQRFRVAVSLALGIGAYATQADRQVESVVIDEGFGSLDKQGRYAMIDELHNLKDVLHRIILVSHEEEFAAAFPNRYVIESVEGRSRASLWSAS